ncbi:hypothetical protein TeGR_g9742, partial [Tetraparma gracilis]
PPPPQALCANGDLATNIRSINLLNGKCQNFLKQLDDAKKAEREARAAERAAKKSKEAAAKKAKKDKEEQARLDRENILKIEASIILNLDKGALPTENGDQRCRQETQFYRYSDKGLQFQFGSADFTGLRLFADGSFEFKHGYKMEFSSARQFVEQSEGLFDDLKGTYDIVWGEMKEENGKKVRRMPKKEEGEQIKGKLSGLRAPQRPSLRGVDNLKRRSSRALLGAISNSKIGQGFARMASSRKSFVGKDEKSISENAQGGEGEEEEKISYFPLEIVLKPEDMEARRQGIDLTQRWGCYAPGDDGKVTTVQRKLTDTLPGEVFVFPET